MVRLRCFGHLLLALMLAMGPVAEAARAAGTTDMSMVKSAMQASLTQACDQAGCDAGASEPCTSADTCSLPCPSMAGLPTAAAVLAPRAATITPPPTDRKGVGWRVPPDPYPPKRFILS